MALLGAVTLHLHPSEAAQICLLTDVHFQIQMQQWRLLLSIAHRCSLLFKLQELPLYSSVVFLNTINQKDYLRPVIQIKWAYFWTRRYPFHQHCLKIGQNCPQLVAPMSIPLWRKGTPSPNLRARQKNPESDSTPVAWERSHQWSLKLSLKALLNVQWGTLCVHYQRSSSKRASPS